MVGTQLLIVALVFIAAILALLFRVLYLRAPGKVKLSFGELFNVEIYLSAADMDRVREAVPTGQRSAGAVKRYRPDLARGRRGPRGYAGYPLPGLPVSAEVMR